MMLDHRGNETDVEPSWDLDVQTEDSGRIKKIYRITSDMPHYYASDDYYSPPKRALPGALDLPTSYSSRYSSSSGPGFNSPSLTAKHSHYDSCHAHYDKPMSSLTSKYSGLNLSPAVGYRPNIATELLLEQNTSSVPLHRSHQSTSKASRRHKDHDDLSHGNPHRTTRHVKSDAVKVGRHTKVTFDNGDSHVGLPPESSSSRRSKKYKNEADKPPASPRVKTAENHQILVVGRKPDTIVADNGFAYSDDDDDDDKMKEGVSMSEAGRWIGCGNVSGKCILTADRGYLIWNRPKGKLEVILRYGETGEEFSCFMDPQFTGVKVLRDRQNGKFEEIIDGVENPKSSRNRHHRHSACRNRPENNFEFDSKSGQVRFFLEALDGVKRKMPVFKINYTLIL